MQVDDGAEISPTQSLNWQVTHEDDRVEWLQRHRLILPSSRLSPVQTHRGFEDMRVSRVQVPMSGAPVLVPRELGDDVVARVLDGARHELVADEW